MHAGPGSNYASLTSADTYDDVSNDVMSTNTATVAVDNCVIDPSGFFLPTRGQLLFELEDDDDDLDDLAQAIEAESAIDYTATSLLQPGSSARVDYPSFTSTSTTAGGNILTKGDSFPSLSLRLSSDGPSAMPSLGLNPQTLDTMGRWGFAMHAHASGSTPGRGHGVPMSLSSFGPNPLSAAQLGAIHVETDMDLEADLDDSPSRRSGTSSMKGRAGGTGIITLESSLSRSVASASGPGSDSDGHSHQLSSSVAGLFSEGAVNILLRKSKRVGDRGSVSTMETGRDLKTSASSGAVSVRSPSSQMDAMDSISSPVPRNPADIAHGFLGMHAGNASSLAPVPSSPPLLSQPAPSFKASAMSPLRIGGGNNATARPAGTSQMPLPFVVPFISVDLDQSHDGFDSNRDPELSDRSSTAPTALHSGLSS
jgi:hypothetical protein